MLKKIAACMLVLLALAAPAQATSVRIQGAWQTQTAASSPALLLLAK